MTTNKYPNADTSPERLAQIEETYFYDGKEGRLLLNDCDPEDMAIHDLLAMLQERAEDDQAIAHELALAGFELGWLCERTILDNVKKQVKEILELRQQLHDQRWRRLSEEPIPFNTPVEICLHEAAHLPNGERVEYISGMRSRNETISFWPYHGDGPFAPEPKDYWRPIPPIPTEK